MYVDVRAYFLEEPAEECALEDDVVRLRRRHWLTFVSASSSPARLKNLCISRERFATTIWLNLTTGTAPLLGTAYAKSRKK